MHAVCVLNAQMTFRRKMPVRRWDDAVYETKGGYLGKSAIYRRGYGGDLNNVEAGRVMAR